MKLLTPLQISSSTLTHKWNGLIAIYFFIHDTEIIIENGYNEEYPVLSGNRLIV